MAREARRNMADARAMEEQMGRMMLHGSGVSSAYGGRMTGAGATPSMGLSQFRGGRRGRRRSPSPDDYDDEDMEGGSLISALIAAAKAAAKAAQTGKAATAAMKQPLLNAAQKAAATGAPTKLSTLGQLSSSLGKTTTALARDAPRLVKEVAIATGQKVAQVGTKGLQAAKAAAPTVGKVVGRVGTVANVAVPAYMLYDYLNQKNQLESELGYYDDYAPPADETEPIDDGVYDPPVIAPPEDEPEPTPPPRLDPRDKDAIAASMGLTRKQYDILVRSGNLPKKGRGMLTIQHEGGAKKKKPYMPPQIVGRMPPKKKTPPKMETLPPVEEDEPIVARPAPVRLPPPVIPPPRRPPYDYNHGMYGPPRPPPPPPMRLVLADKARKAREAVGLTASGRKSKATGRRQERAEIVKRVMRERGVKLGEASRIVKEEGLF